MKTLFALLLAVLLQGVGFLLFARGFFPQKVLLSGSGDFYDSPLAQLSSYNEKAPFDKLIFVVIDALRSDFVFLENLSMPFLHSLLNLNAAIGYTAFSNPPTVTLPRLKGITTGSTLAFLDAILNVNEDDTSGLGGQDSWPAQFSSRLHKDRAAKLHFFGDDTWLKLFPDLFEEVDGTLSFFVSDFTEVDNNVTRHITPQLENDQWDALILHYLGLDHIGHKSGPESIYMPDKQREMDGIISRLYQYTLAKHDLGEEVLMVVLGDHGMNEIGNHGGLSVGETSAALTFISPVFAEDQSYTDLKNPQTVPVKVNNDYQFLESTNQINLVPTICDFFHLPLPKNNLGVLLKKFIYKDKNGRLDYADIFYKLSQNAYQFRELVEAKFGRKLPAKFDEASSFDESDYGKLSFLWNSSVLKLESILENDVTLTKVSDSDLDLLINAFYSFLLETQEHLQNTSTNYDVPLLEKALICLAASASILAMLFIQHLRFLKGSYLFGIFTLIAGISTFGSSTVEEEHQFWWLFSLIYVIYISIGLVKCYPIALKTVITYTMSFFVLLRAIRFWNASGQKYNFLPEFVDLKLSYYLSSEYKSAALWILFVVVFMQSQLLSNGGLNLVHNYMAFVLPFTISLMILSFKVNFDYINTGGKNYQKFFLVIIEKTNSILNNADSKELLISLAQIVFYLLAGCLLFRVALRYTSFLWFNRFLERKERVVERKTTNDEATIVKTQLIQNKGKKNNQKIMNKIESKTVYKNILMDGRYRFVLDIVGVVNMLLIMQTKLENVGLYFVFFLLREISLKLINRIIYEELKIVALETISTEEIAQTEQEKMFMEELKDKAVLISRKKLHIKLSFYITVQTIILQNLTFFQFGFTNSLSTVDLANAYNGTRSYNLVLVGFLTFVSNFTSAIYWSFSSIQWLFDNNLINNDPASHATKVSSFLLERTKPSIKWEIFYTRWLVQLFFYTLTGLALCVACYNLRYHLFIWTVFSPKLLFFGVWNFLMTMVIEGLVGAVIFMI